MMCLDKGRLVFSLVTYQGINRRYKIFHFLITCSHKCQLVLIKRPEHQHLTGIRDVAQRTSLSPPVICHLGLHFPSPHLKTLISQQVCLGFPAYFMNSTQNTVEMIQCSSQLPRYGFEHTPFASTVVQLVWESLSNMIFYSALEE